jgi:hypothetical protein
MCWPCPAHYFGGPLLFSGLPRQDQRGADLSSDALPFGRL